MAERDNTIDIVKSIGILLMILGHHTLVPDLLTNFIFSFHMPLFFILSGYFYRRKDIHGLIKSDMRHLVRPYFITAFFCILTCLINGNPNGALMRIVSTVASNGSPVTAMFFPGLPLIGPIWFLLALFWCKIFYIFLDRKTNNTLLWSFFISTSALLFGKYITNLPFGFLNGFCALVFYAMGDYWNHKTSGKMNTCLYIAGLSLWIFCIFMANLDLSYFECSLYPISMFASFIGTYTVYHIARRTPQFMVPILTWLGKNTLLILCYHTLAFYIVTVFEKYLSQPLDMVPSSLSLVIINFILSLGLPYTHYKIQRLNKSCS